MKTSYCFGLHIAMLQYCQLSIYQARFSIFQNDIDFKMSKYCSIQLVLNVFCYNYTQFS